MDETRAFQSALSNFATDVACGGAIRHLTDIGYTLEQIIARLDYPVSRQKAQRIMMEHLYQSRVLLRKSLPRSYLRNRRSTYRNRTPMESVVYGK